MDEEQFKQLSYKMDTIIRLLALNSVEGKQLKDQVSVLSSFGFQPKQIADILNKNRNTIRSILHRLQEARGELEVEEANENTESTEEDQHI